MMAKPHLSRRAFLGGAAAVAAAPWIVPATALGRGGRIAPSERILVGSIGTGGRGTFDLNALFFEPDAQVVAVCDVRGDRRRAARALVNQHYGGEVCAEHIDLRELLAREDLDAVVIAMGDRWHTMAATLALRAGKDVYCEKPCSLSMQQSQSLLAAARAAGRVFQAGTQRRSEEKFIFAAELARQGYLGKVHTMWAGLYDAIPQRFNLPAQPLPPREELDWDLFLGPAPWREYNAEFLNWYGKLDMDGGAITGWATHTLDLCQWADGTELESGAEFEPGTNDNGDNLAIRMPGGTRMILVPRTAFPGTCGVKYIGDKGWAWADDGTEPQVSDPALLNERKRLVDQYLERSGRPIGHMRDFLNCVRSRRPAAANPEIMHRVHTTTHAAVVCNALKRKVVFDWKKEEFPGDEEANRLRIKPMRSPWCV